MFKSKIYYRLIIVLIILFSSLVLMSILLSSCKKLLEVDPPASQIEEAIVFSSDETALATMAGLYSRMTPNLVLSNGALTLHGGLSADELQQTATNADLDAFAKNALTPTNSYISGRFWSHAFPVIYHVNRIIEGLEKTTTLTVTVQQQLKGEAHFIRAFYYYYLAQLFGDVPLVLTTDYLSNAQLPRQPVADVYVQVKNDLLLAEQLMSVTYPAAGKVRPNKLTATAFLARLYLLLGDIDKAESSASQVIANSTYALETNLNNVFLSSSKEVIWQLRPTATNFNTSEGLTFIPATATSKPAFIVTSALLNAFETGDNRKNSWTKTVTISGTPYTYPYKYKVGNNATAITEHNVLFRLAEQYLTRAEARALKGDLNGSKSDLNLVRARAGLSPSAATTASEILAAIRQERRIELFAELGFRWLDLKRWGMAGSVLSTIKTDWQETDVLYPLPQTEIDRNSFLVQNPGY